MARRKLENVKRLGEILVEAGQVTQEQLEKALTDQRKNGGLLGEILVGWGHTTEEGIVQAVSNQYKFPYIEPTNYKCAEKAIELIPKEFASRFSLVALDVHGKALSIAMSNPLHQEAIDQLEEMTSCEVHAFITTYTEIMRTLERHYQVRKPGSTS